MVSAASPLSRPPSSSMALEALRAVVGDALTTPQLSDLLHAHAGDATAAANAFLDGAAVLQPPPRRVELSWPQPLGAIETDAFSLVRLRGEALCDARLELEPPRGSRRSAEEPRKLPAKRKLSDEMQPLRIRRSSVDAAGGPAAGAAIGRLPLGVSRYLQPLLLDGKVEVDVELREVPLHLELMSTLRLRLHVRVHRAAFLDEGGAAHADANGDERQLAFARLLEAVQLLPCNEEEPNEGDARAASWGERGGVDGKDDGTEREESVEMEVDAGSGAVDAGRRETELESVGKTDKQPMGQEGQRSLMCCEIGREIESRGKENVEEGGDAHMDYVEEREACDEDGLAADAVHEFLGEQRHEKEEGSTSGEGGEKSGEDGVEVESVISGTGIVDGEEHGSADEVTSRSGDKETKEDGVQKAESAASGGQCAKGGGGGLKEDQEKASPGGEECGRDGQEQETAGRGSDDAGADGLEKDTLRGGAEDGREASQASSTPSGGDAMNAEQRARIAHNRQMAMERRKLTSAAAGEPLSDEQRALLEEKRAAAQRKRQQREAERERRVVAARFGPLLAGFHYAARTAALPRAASDAVTAPSAAEARRSPTIKQGWAAVPTPHRTAKGEGMGEAVGVAAGEAAGEARGDPQGKVVGAAMGDGRGEEIGDGRGEAMGEANGETAGVVADSEGSGELCGSELHAVFEQLSTESAALPTLEPPPTLKAELRVYQKQSLWWMVSREEGTGERQTSGTTWQHYRLPCGLRFYMHPTSGHVSLRKPLDEGETRGGILADEMGLGKTIQVIALLLHDRWQQQPPAPAPTPSPPPPPPPPLPSPPPPPSPPPAAPRDAFAALMARRGGKRAAVSRQPPAPTSAPHQLVAHCGVLRSAADSQSGATLILCPMSLLAHWVEELATRARCREGACATPHGLQLIVYYGMQRGELPPVMSARHVVLSSYGTAASEWASPARRKGLHRVLWRRLVIDEAHEIKNPASKTARAVFTLKAERRWALTGTPLQNRLSELYSLLHFLRLPGIPCAAAWQRMGATPACLQQLQRWLRPLMLRRTKSSRDTSGQLILQLPPRCVRVVHLHMSDAERDFYSALHARSRTQFHTFVAEGKVLSKYSSVLALLLQLRQACDHPFLVLSRADATASAASLARQLPAHAAAFLSGLASTRPASAPSAPLAPEEAAAGVAQEEAADGATAAGVAEGTTTERAAEGTTAEGPAEGTTTEEGEAEGTTAEGEAEGTKAEVEAEGTTTEGEAEGTTAEGVAEGTATEGAAEGTTTDGVTEGEVAEGATVAGVAKGTPVEGAAGGVEGAAAEGVEEGRTVEAQAEMDSVGDAKGVATRAVAEAVAPEGEVSEAADRFECPVCLEPPEDAVLTSCGHCFCRECILGCFGRSQLAHCPLCRQTCDRAKLVTVPRNSRFSVDVEDESKWRSSAKVEALLAALHEVAAEDERRGESGVTKSVVFSQWTGMLDLVATALRRDQRFRFCRLDGSMATEDRQKNLTSFRTERGVRVMLLSLKAGGVGLNLTAAQRVFLLDPWWNPAVEQQAMDRVHRIGQTQPVIVTRFIVKGTVEEKMLQLQERKRALCSSALGAEVDGDSNGRSREEARKLRIQDLAFCFE